MHELLPSELHESHHSMSESVFYPYPLVNGQTMLEWSTEHLAPTRDEAKFLSFLSLYGSNGVSLRDLLRFATLRASGKPSQNHWLLSGEVGPILRPLGDKRLPTHCSFLNAFVRETSNNQGINALQSRLLSLGLIRVEYPRFAVRRANERIWRVAENPVSSHLMVPTWHDPDGEDIIMDLLYVFLEMPSKDVSLLAERHRETFYTHARTFALETLRLNHTVLKDARDYTVMLILQILTHRFQNGDSKLIQLAKAWPSSANSFEWTIMVLWAELKEKVASGVSSIETALTNRITRLLSWKGKRQCRANGLIGYLLVEWMKAAEASRDSKLNSQIVNYALDWAEVAWFSGSSIERAALCCVLANFGMLDKSVLVPPKYHLLYGHHLSRAGHLKEAEEFLTSGFLYYSSLQLSTRPWGYQFELVSVLIQLGHQRQAERLLTDIEEHSMYLYKKREIIYRREKQQTNSSSEYDEFDSPEQLHELAETSILSGLYQAELLMSAGKLSLVVSRLDNGIDLVRRNWRIGKQVYGEDSYFRSLRLAVEMRLLEVQTWEGPPERALRVAEGLMTEFWDESNLGPDTAQWIMQQLLILSNRLVCAGKGSAALSLLENMRTILRYQPYSDSLKDLLPYAEQRWATISDLLATDYAQNGPTGVDYERQAATNEGPEDLHGPSNENLSPTKSALSDSTDVIARAPHYNARPPAIINSRNDPRSLVSATSLGVKTEMKTNKQNILNRRGSPEEPKASKSATSGPTEKASLMKPTFPRENLQRGRLSKSLVQQRVRRSVAILLRRAPRVPTTEPALPVIGSKEKERAPVPMELPMEPLIDELATA